MADGTASVIASEVVLVTTTAEPTKKIKRAYRERPVNWKDIARHYEANKCGVSAPEHARVTKVTDLCGLSDAIRAATKEGHASKDT